MLTRVVYLSALASLAAAHRLITVVQGSNGVTGAGMGVDPSTPRNGVTAKPFQQDTSIIRDSEIMTGKVGPCGRTKQKGAIDIDAEMTAASSAGLPSISSNGEIQMTLHQVNQDGAGPYTCDVSADGGKSFQPATVTKNIPGIPLIGLSLAAAKDFPLNVQMPAGMQCAGGPNGDACIVRGRNTTPAGLFGSCAIVTDIQKAGGASAPAGAGAQKAAGGVAKAVTPAGVVGAIPAAISDAIPPIVPDTAATVLSGVTKLVGGRRAITPDSINPVAAIGAVPAAIADAIPPIVPDTAATALDSLTKLVGPRRATAADGINPAAVIGAVPAAIADTIPPIVPDTAATVLDGLTKLVGARAYPANERALAGPEEFAAQDAKDAKLEEKLIADLQKGKAGGEKHIIRSRIAGSLSGQWI